MDNGGCVYIEGSNVGYDHHTTAFFAHLGAGFANIGGSNLISRIEGVQGTFAAPNEFPFPDGDPDYNVDELLAGQGTSFLTCQNNRVRAVFYDSGNYRAICSSIILGVLADDDFTNTKASLMARYLGYLTGSTDPDICVSNEEFDFGIQYVNYDRTIPLEIQNLGFADLNISSIAINGEGFTMDSEPSYILESGGEISLDVTFHAPEAGTYEGDITIISDDPDNGTIVIDLLAECLLPPAIVFSTDELSVEIEQNQTANRIVTINNAGNSDLSFAIQLENADLGLVSRDIVNYYDFDGVMLSKYDYDYREGPPVICGSGGPDNFGYKWIDSNEPNGPEYEWFDISTIGQNSGLTGDDNSVSLTLPFIFKFYGQAKTSVRVSSNGYLTFGSDGGVYINDPIPGSNSPNDIIAPFWDDLHQQSGSNYYYHDEDNRRFIIQYNNWGFFSSSGSLTFQVQLYENDGIYFYYNSMSGTLNSATIGIENANGTDGLQVAYNTTYMQNGLAIRLSSGPMWLSVDPESGTIPAGSSADITFTFDSNGLEEGTYNAQAVINSNDPAIPETVIPVTLICGPVGIDDVPLPYRTCLNSNYPNPFNASTFISFDLAEKTQVTVDIFNVLGQKVITLVDEVMEAGTHKVKWEADVTSGMYFYRMKTGDYVSTKKMVLLK
jgi:hypothetical protein